MTSTSRQNDLDTAKGLGMIMVVIGHAQPPDTIQTVIYSVHMPLFFFVSGLLWRGQVKLRHSFHALWRPFIWASLVSWIFWLLKSAVHQSATENVPWWGPIIVTAWGGDIGGFFVHNRPLWFLPAMLSMLIAIWALRVFLSSRWTIYSIALVGLSMTFVPAEHHFSAYPFSAIQGLIGGIFFSTGQILARGIKVKSRIATLTALSIWIYTAIHNGRVDLFSINLGNQLLYVIAGCTGSWSIVRICQTPLIQAQPLLIIGRQSLMILCIHMPLLILIRAAFKATQIPEYWWALSSICIFFTTAVAIVIDRRMHTGNPIDPRS